MAFESIETKILSSIKKCGRGNLLFASDFIRYGEQKSVNKALERMMKDGLILRISHGIYYYPKIDKVLGLGVLYPTLEDIAEGIAKRDKARIAPTGLYALNRLGFSTQIPMNVVYLTDSFNRKIKLYNGTIIQFVNKPVNSAHSGELTGFFYVCKLFLVMHYCRKEVPHDFSLSSYHKRISGTHRFVGCHFSS